MGTCRHTHMDARTGMYTDTHTDHAHTGLCRCAHTYTQIHAHIYTHMGAQTYTHALCSKQAHTVSPREGTVRRPLFLLPVPHWRPIEDAEKQTAQNAGQPRDLNLCFNLNMSGHQVRVFGVLWSYPAQPPSYRTFSLVCPMSLYASRGRELITFLDIYPSARQLTTSEGSSLASHMAGKAPSPLCASVYTTTNRVVVPTAKLVSFAKRLTQGCMALS